MKTLAVGISGLFSGLAGAQLAMDRLNFFLPDMTAGRGIIELAATLFGSGLPSMSAAASFMFGLFGAIGDRLQAFEIPDQFVLKLRNIAAIVGLTLAGWRIHVKNHPAKLEAERDPMARRIVLDCDPEAASIVFSSGLDAVLIPIDAAAKVGIDNDLAPDVEAIGDPWRNSPASCCARSPGRFDPACFRPRSCRSTTPAPR